MTINVSYFTGISWIMFCDFMLYFNDNEVGELVEDVDHGDHHIDNHENDNFIDGFGISHMT